MGNPEGSPCSSYPMFKTGVLAKFKFRVVDGRFGETQAEEGAFPIEITRAAVTDDTTEMASLGGELLRIERSGIEAVLQGAVVVHVEHQ